MAQLIDTSVLINIERQRRPISDLTVVAFNEPTALAAITAAEILVGVLRSISSQRRIRGEAFVEAVLERLPVLAFDLRVARVHAEIWAALAASGQAIGSHDAIIAATALSYGYAVLTDNIREFNRVPGLEVRQPDW